MNMDLEQNAIKNMTNIKKTTDATSIANRVYALGYGEGVNQLTICSVYSGRGRGVLR